MPYSLPYNISAIAVEIYHQQPKSVLDLGAGTGLWGAITRQYCDFIHGRFDQDRWKTKILGYEAFCGYENPLWEMYDDVYPFDFTDPTLVEDSGLSGWDLVLMIDSLEHLEPEAGRAFLDRIVRDNRRVIVSVPLGTMEQGAVHGNEYERHRTTFNGSEFDRYYGHTVLCRNICLTVAIAGGLK